jgi:hypothetical protein
MLIIRMIQIIFICTGFVFCLTGYSHTNDFNHYHISLDNKLANLRVHACFPQHQPDALQAGSAFSVKYLVRAGFSINGVTRPLPVNRRLIDLQDLPVGTCLDYAVSLARYHQTSKDDRIRVKIPDTIKTKAGDWLWLPVDQTGPIQMDFDLPTGIEIATPWPLNNAEQSVNKYMIDPDDSVIDSQVYFGVFNKRELIVSGARIRLAIMGDISSETQDKLADWVQYGADSVVSLYGRYPLSSPLIMVFPIGPYDSAVPWGEVKRDGGACALLYVDHTRSLQELIGDWTLIHELSHMTHPYLDYSGRWITEGLATYYQNVLQARVGTLTAKQAWMKIHQGFERGRKETAPGERLIDISSNMRTNRLFMRIYWSGVALALKADWLLRKNGSSLDLVLSGFQRCCLAEKKNWTSLNFMQKLDELSATQIFTGLYNEYAYSDRFPDISDVYVSLGIRKRQNSVQLSHTASDVNIRQDIMRNRRDEINRQDIAGDLSD